MTSYFAKWLLCSCLLCLSGLATAQTTLVVLNTSDNETVKGSLRYCLAQARTDRANRVNIEFGTNITSITLTNGSIDVSRPIGKSLYIYGNGRVILRGTGNKVNQGFRTEGDGYIAIYGLQFENFSQAIYAYRYTEIGNGTATNANVFINNTVAIFSLGAFLYIDNNYIGTNKLLATNLGNGSNILTFGGAARIQNNTITSARTGDAINLIAPAGSISQIKNNTIGSATAALGNFGYAIKVFTGGAYITNNIIANNGSGILTTGQSELKTNYFNCNKQPIFDPSLPYATPIVDSLYYNQNGTVFIYGRSNKPGDVIEVYEAVTVCPTLPCQGNPRGRVIADATGKWRLTFRPTVIGTSIVANASIEGAYDVIGFAGTAFDTQGRTSEFTACAVPKCPTVAVNLQKIADVNCFGSSDGQARVSITPTGTGGSFRYYVAETEATIPIYKTITSFDTVKNLQNRTYTAFVQNTLTGCQYKSAPITVNQPAAPLSLSNCREISPTSTPTASNGRGEITISGGTPPYTISYRKDGGAVVNLGRSSSSVVAMPNLAAGNYVVTVMDAKFNAVSGKTCTATCNFTITPPFCTALKATMVLVTNLPCFDSVGSFRVKCVDVATNLPLTLTISNNLGVVSTRTINSGGFPADSTFTISNLKAGTYNISLSSRNGTCTVTTNTTLTEPTKLSILCDTVIHVARVGDATGGAEMTTSGGSVPYRLSLSGAMNRPNFITVSSPSVSVSISNLIKGNYVATAVDGNGCRDTCQFTVTEPNCRGFNLTADPDSVKCFGESNGRIALAVMNGDSNYTFQWSVQSIGNQSIASGLDVGTYRATVTDGRNCRDSVQAIISTPSVLRASTVVDSIRTAGGTGTISITASGGKSDYSVELILNNNPRTLTQRNGNTFVFANLSKGTYTYTLTDANGCDTTGTATLDDLLCKINIDAKADSVSCKNGTNGRITTTVTNGSAPLTYTWSNAVSTTATATGLRAATYWVAVTDSRACVDSAYITVYESDSLSSIAIKTDVTRIAGTDGTIRVTTRGGTLAYTARLANGTLGTRESPNTFIFNNLPKGTYNINITDAKGCTDSKTVEINEPVCSLTISPQTDSVRCNGGSDGRIALNVGNGFAPLSIRWSGGIPNDVVAAGNLRAGSYTASITDGRGCTFVTNPIVIAQPTRLTSTFTTTKTTRVDSQDGAVQVIVSGGTQPYSVLLGTTTATVVNATTFKFTGLAVGRYAYTVTDVKGCTTSDSVVIEGPICSLRLSRQIDSVRCNGTATGRIVLTATNATNPLIFNWTPNVNTTTNTANNLSAGIYYAAVTDANGCIAYDTIQVFEPVRLSSTFTKTDVRVPNGSDGTISIKVAGGTPQYSVQIAQQNATFSNDSFRFTGLASGSYTYTVTDAKGCTTENTVVINAPNCNLTLTTQTVDSVTCNGTATGRIILRTSGGTAPLSINWSLASIGNTLTANNLRAGTYMATVTDASRCTSSVSVQVFEPVLLSSTFTATQITAVGQTGSIQVVVSGGTQPYISAKIGTTNATVVNGTTFNFAGLAAGTYTYIVTDSKGCTTTGTAVINAPNCSLTAQLSIRQAISCFGATDGSISLTTNAQTPQYIWSNGSTLQNLTNVEAGTYKVTITDAQNCTQTAQITLTEPTQIRATIVGDTAICAGQSARLRFTVVGATNFSLVFSDGVNNTTTISTEVLVTPTTQTTFRLVSVQSGACLGVVSGSATVQMTTVPPPTIISIVRDSLCKGSDLIITTPPSAVPNIQYVWQTPTGVVTTTTPNLTIRNANATHSGLYTLKFAVNTCQSAATPVLRVTVLELPTQSVFAGDDKVVCGGTTTTLSAQAIANQQITGNWVALDGATIAQPNVSNSAVSGLKTENNRFVWSLTSSVCGKIGTPDTVNIFVEKTPIALAKQFVLEGTLGSILINIKGLLVDSSNVKFSTTAANNNISTTADNRFILFKRGDLTNAQTFDIPYQVCSERCPNLCASNTLFINIAKLIVSPDSLSVDKILVSNSSTKSTLEIKNIDRYEENECLIVDRWGTPVFGPINYINDTPDHAWNGKKNGNPLPNGAYYYILKYKDKDQKRIERGVIYLVEGL